MIGCKAHQLALAVQEYFYQYPTRLKTIKLINKLMVKLKYSSNLRGQLELLFQPGERKLGPRTYNKTRWNSIFDVLERYSTIKDKIIQIDGLQDDLLTENMNNIAEQTRRDLELFYFASLQLQRDDCTLSEARVVFDQLIDQFPFLINELGPRAENKI